VPESVTLCGLSPALSLRDSVAERAPAPLGVKTNEITVLPCGATVMGNCEAKVGAKSLALDPVTDAPVITRGALPVFETIRVEAALDVLTGWGAKLMVDLSRLTTGALLPVPDNGTVWPPALSVKTRLALRTPIALGVKVTVTEAMPPLPGIESGNCGEVKLKSLLCAPVIAMFDTVTVALPVLLKVSGCDAAVPSA